MKVDIDRLRRVTRGAILASGYAESDSEIILEIILYAQLRGNNQNVIKLVGAGMPADPNAGAIRVLPRDATVGAAGWRLAAGHGRDEPCLRYGGRQSFGARIWHRRHPAALTRPPAPSVIMRGESPMPACSVLCFPARPNSWRMHGSYEAFLGTNPLAIGIPTADSPIVLDMATAAIAWYGVVLANAEGKTIPDGVAYDADGNVTTDAAAALAGAIKAFGGYKGAGLALIVEILTRPLVGARYDDDGRKLDWGRPHLRHRPNASRR